MSKTVVHTHRHSEFSLMDGTGTAQQYAEEAVRLGQPALTLTDHGSLSGALHHYKACKELELVPLLGVEAYFKPNRFLKDVENKEFFHLVLIAKDLVGWHNLMRITSEAYHSGFYHKPCIDFDLLSRYSNGLICSTACMSSYLCKSILRGDTKTVKSTLEFFKKTFGDDLFIEIMPHDIDDQRTLNLELVNIAASNSIPLISTVDAHYPYKEWADTQDIVLMMATGQSFDKRKKKRDAGEDVYQFDVDSLYLMGREDIETAFQQNHPQLPEHVVTESIDNTLEVLARTVPFLIDQRQKMPKVETDSEKAVWRWCVEGLDRIDKAQELPYIERFKYEFSVLKKNEVLDYFYIVGDVCRWARSQGIRMGVGRGSAAGCLVSYLIGITHLDPISHDLLFERFLNPDRKGMPDIDLDFQSDRRHEVKAYLSEKYGEDHVADICSHQTYRPRAAIKKVAIVYDVPYPETTKVTNSIDETTTDPLDKLRETNGLLDAFANKWPDAWKHARRVQGQVHTLSKHPGGVVITDKPVSEYMPTMIGKDKTVLTAWGARSDFNIIDEYGFMKIDVLGLKSLAMQEYACDLIFERTGERINLNELPVCADPNDVQLEVMEAFTNGYVLGVFQFTGSPGFSKLIRSFKPSWLGDLGAANAVYRPGPLNGGVHTAYSARKFGREEVEFFNERAEPALAPTFGLIVYQEQIMRLAKDMANFTGGEADALRKAISKEYRNGKPHVIKWLQDRGYTQKWIDGCRENGISDTVIEYVWDLIINFGDYGFNKSHAYAYAVQAYQDMWLKVNYPTEFYAALMTFDPDLSKKVLREARVFGVQVLPPNINKSKFGFSVDDKAIRYGLRAVKNLGDVGANAILENQPFTGLDDFRARVAPRKCNRRALESLVQAGAFDDWGARDDWHPDEVTAGETAILGVMLSESQAVVKYHDLIASRINKDFDDLPEGSGVTIGGEVVHYRAHTTKKHQQMCFLTIQFDGLEWSCTVFPDDLREHGEILYEGHAIMIRGRKQDYNSKVNIVLDSACGIEELAMALSTK